jgi:hypothetical protein
VKPVTQFDATKEFTFDEFEAAEFDLDFRYELVHGLVIVLPIPPAEVRDANEHLGH